ncbi:MAG: hypothetical protein ABFC96_16960 [Thermoguttaceae bacterium]
MTQRSAKPATEGRSQEKPLVLCPGTRQGTIRTILEWLVEIIAQLWPW